MLSTPLALLALLMVLPTLASASPPPPQVQYFPESGHAAHNWYWQFWKNTPNALRVLGYPIAEPFIQESFTEPGKFYRVQYFERAVLEEHPENFGKDNNRFYILGRLLGNELIKGRENEEPFRPVPQIPSNANQTWFPETQHTLRNDPVRGPFKQFWEQYGGLVVFGFPKSEPFQEKNPDTGETYWVQYFERNRFEYHPNERDPSFRVLLGRLGDQYAKQNPGKVNGDAFRYRQPAESMPEPFVYGSNAMLYYTDRDRALTLAKIGFESNNTSGGPTWIRQQVPWQDHMNCDGSIAWGELDKVVDAAAAKGVKLMFSVVRAPSCFTVDGSHGMPTKANFGRFAQFLRAIAERYRGKVHAIELWNEQNYAIENGGVVADPAFYVDLMVAGYDAIKSVDSSIIVVSGSPTPTETNKRNIAFSDLDYLRAMFRDPRFRTHMDVVGVHPAGTLNPPDALPEPNRPQRGVCDGWNGNTEFYFRRLEQIRNIMVQENLGDRQMWVTEFGWATQNNTPGYEYGGCNTLDEQGAYTRRAIELARYNYAPWVGAMFVWNLNFAVTWQGAGNPLHEQASFGILNPDWSPRPAFDAIQNMPKP
jgi:polysaccharide biosynthesis protein PslG